jgi:outer membrane protein insertion porin family
VSVDTGIVFQSICLNPTRRTSVWVLFLLVTLLPATQAHAQLPSGGGFEPVVLDSVDVEGNIRQADLTIMDMGGLSPGSPYTIFDIQRAFKAMWATGQFEDIRVRVEGDVGDGMVTLIWEVEEQDLLRNVAITGLTSVNPGDITDETSLNSGFPYSPTAVLDAKASIRAELATKGIPFANIVERIERVPNRGKEIVLFLDVEEGTRVTVADVTFSGNTTFSDSDLRGAMSLKSEGFLWWKSGLYDRERYDEDLQTGLPDFYAARGFLDFTVVGDSLIIDPITGKTRLEISVDEGPLYRLREFIIVGNSEFSTDELQRIFQPEQSGLFGSSDSGETELPIFENDTFQEATGVANELYQNEGYLYSQVTPFVRQNETAEGEVHTVDVGWAIDEGPQAYISRVDIEGNEYTYSRVIRDKIFVLPGDVYSQERIIQSFQSISSLGYFEPMAPPSIIPNEAGDVDVTFTVVEKPTGAINFGTSVGGGTGGFSGFIGYDQPNLFGKGKSGNLRWDFGAFQNNQVLSYSDPGVFESLVSANVNLFNARDRFISFRSGRRRRIGSDFRLGFLIPGARFTRFFTGYGLSRTVLELQSGGNDLSLFGIAPGTQSTVSAGITRSTLNHTLFPTIGSRQSVNIEFTGGPLGGDGKFVKYTANGSWWLPIGVAGGDGSAGSGITLALGMTMRLGALQGNSAPFPFDGFWMGGVQFGEQLRGYDETTITPFGYFDDESRNVTDIDRLGHAFFSMTTEVAMRMGAQFSASIFMDAGNVWRHAAEIDPSQLFRGAGVGIQLVTPFGPIGLDYAYGFDKAVPGWQLHFRLGGGL